MFDTNKVDRGSDIDKVTGELYFNDSKPDGTMVKLTDKVELEKGIKTMYDWYLKI